MDYQIKIWVDSLFDWKGILFLVWSNLILVVNFILLVAVLLSANKIVRKF